MEDDQPSSRAIQREISELGDLLGQTLKNIAGQDKFECVEEIRLLSREARSGDRTADEQIQKRLTQLDCDQLHVVIRAFSIFLDLVNIAEDRQRVRVLGERARNAQAGIRKESIAEAVQQLKKQGLTPEEFQQLLDHLNIELVFTAHPTEAKRRSIRSKLRRIRQLLEESAMPTHGSNSHSKQQSVLKELTKLWLTDFIRPKRPTVLQEVQRGLSFKPVLWQVVPEIIQELRTAVTEAYGNHPFKLKQSLRFGSWIGGDRDGHPYVTTDVTRQTLVWLREEALALHLKTCVTLIQSFSLSSRLTRVEENLSSSINAALDVWPQLEPEVTYYPENELFRRWLVIIQWRLQQTQKTSLTDADIDGAYKSSEELLVDVEVLKRSLCSVSQGQILVPDVETWLDQIRIFGFSLARLDVRQDARKYHALINEIFENSGLCQHADQLTEAERQALLIDTMFHQVDFSINDLTEFAQDALSLFRLLDSALTHFGSEAIGTHVISMTKVPSDVLTVMWLWQHRNPNAQQQIGENQIPISVSPLFETISDLENAPAIMESLFQLPCYRDYLTAHDNHLIAMIGYSDSTKDGGYLSACWSLYQAQQQLHRIARLAGVELTFFHGRGGSLGRGGGPAARGILSLPRETFKGSLRLTEQGEVLADRYDNPQIAHRHLEQIFWSSLLAIGEPDEQVPEQIVEMMQEMASTSFHAYRNLVEQPGFVEFFRSATPISEIEELPIGSRPARRGGGHELTDLRAIPWVFSWTQCRCLIPAWYGFGSAVQSALNVPDQLEQLQTMYQDWPFFRATVDNAELALAKTDLGIAEHYAELAMNSVAMNQIGNSVFQEYHLTRKAILQITQNEELLDGIPWLKDSIHARNRYIDPLNLIQVELLRRFRNLQPEQTVAESDNLQNLIRLTIKGIAAGMRTTG